MIVAFDIETIPDIDSGRKLLGLEGIGPKEVHKAMLAHRRLTLPDTDFLPLHLHRVVAISLAFYSPGRGFDVKSIGEIDATEKELVQRFFKGIDRQSPDLVSWNGAGFDLPVLRYRALLHGVSCQTYWDTGQFDRETKWNNYLSRYHEKHLDLMDYIAGYQARGAAPLHEIAVMLGLPGKIGIGGANVFSAYLEGRIEEIRDYCEVDALNTYLIHLRLRLIRGNIERSDYLQHARMVQRSLQESSKNHLKEYAKDWCIDD